MNSLGVSEIRRSFDRGPRHHFEQPAGGRVPGAVYRCQHCTVEMKILRRGPGKDEKLYRSSPDDAFSLRFVPCVIKGKRSGGGRSEEISTDPHRSPGITCDPPEGSAIPDADLLTVALDATLRDFHESSAPIHMEISRLLAELARARASLELLRQDLSGKLSRLCRTAAGLDGPKESD